MSPVRAGALTLGPRWAGQGKAGTPAVSAVWPSLAYAYTDGHGGTSGKTPDLSMFNDDPDHDHLPPTQLGSGYPGGFVFGFVYMDICVLQTGNDWDQWSWTANPGNAGLYDGSYNYVVSAQSNGYPNVITVSGNTSGAESFTMPDGVVQGLNLQTMRSNRQYYEGVISAVPEGDGEYTAYYGVLGVVSMAGEGAAASGYTRGKVENCTPAELWAWTSYGQINGTHFGSYSQYHPYKTTTWTWTFDSFSGVSAVSTGTAIAAANAVYGPGITLPTMRERVVDGCGAAAPTNEELEEQNAGASTETSGNVFSDLLDIGQESFNPLDAVKDAVGKVQGSFQRMKNALRSLFFWLDPWQEDDSD